MKQKRDFKLLMQVLENIDLRHSTALPRQNKKKGILEKLDRLLEIIYSMYCGKGRSFMKGVKNPQNKCIF